MLNHLYDGTILRDKPADVENNLFQFDQKEFFPNQDPRNASLDDIGYVYIPVIIKNHRIFFFHSISYDFFLNRLNARKIQIRAIHANFMLPFMAAIKDCIYLKTKFLLDLLFYF